MDTFEKSYEGYGCFIVVAVVLAIIGFCGYQMHLDIPSIPYDPQRIDIEQLMEREQGHYSIKYQAEDGTLGEMDLGYWPKIMTDVPADQHSWVLLSRAKTKRGNIECTGHNEIHIHAASEINGGGYHYGKGGHAQTTVVQ